MIFGDATNAYRIAVDICLWSVSALFDEIVRHHRRWPMNLISLWGHKPRGLLYHHDRFEHTTMVMKQTRLQPPRAPPDHLRLQSFQILSRLELIQEFRPWLDYTRHYVHRKRHTPLELLWDCFSFGAPLGTLLNLLGSPSPSHLVEHVENFDFRIRIEEREIYFTSFIQRVQLLEAQGRLPYGEVLRCNDFLSDANSAFAKVRRNFRLQSYLVSIDSCVKVLRTVYRLLVALEESYPGLFVAPLGSQTRRRELMQELVDTEEAHLAILKTVVVSSWSRSVW